MEIETEILESVQPKNMICPKTFWKNLLRGFTSPTPLPGNQSGLKNSVTEVEYQEQIIQLSETTISSLNFLVKDHNLTFSTLLYGAWALLLYRYSQEEDVMFGIQAPSTAGESGLMAVHPIPMRIRLIPDIPLLSWLKELQIQWETLLSYGGVSLTQLQEWSEVSISKPLFESLIVVLDSSIEISSEGEESQTLYNFKVPLTVAGYVASAGNVELRIKYNRHRFDNATIARMQGHLQMLLQGMVTHPEQCPRDLPLLTVAERHQLLVEWNATQVDYPKDKCIQQIFEEQVEQSPEAIAVVMPASAQVPGEQLTYQELNDRANQLASHLQQLGVKPGTFVAMSLERSIEMIVAMLGILKAGGVYVPLDPAYPQERLALMLEDINASVLLTQSRLMSRLPVNQAHILCLDANWRCESQLDLVPLRQYVSSSSLAYINFTSGSTGRPKGVAIPHRGVLRLVFGVNYTQLDANQTILQLAPISFDAATFEIWGALLHGARCVLFPGNGIPDPKDLGAILKKNQISTLWLTAALFNSIIAEAPEALTGVKELLTGGEALSIAHIRQALKLLPGTQLINGYGPTESTTFTCCYRIPHQLEADLTSIPIGKPIANTQVYILDANLQPVPIGVVGELHIGGDGLAREYLNLPELTQERFIPNPFCQESTAYLYKTGDLVRYLPDGNIEFVGRKDDQVKIRGYRIELGEIETILGQHDSVGDAVVVVREDMLGDKRLIAYVAPKGERQPNVNQLKAYLTEQLSEYMVPAVIIVLDKIPLTPNGKADRRALPIPASGTGSKESFIAPSTAVEKMLAEIWCGVLGLSQVGIEDNFFDLGGTSILGLHMVARVQKQFAGTNLRAVKLYQYPTIRTLAQYLSQEGRQQLGGDVQVRIQRQKAARSHQQRAARR